MRISVRTSPNNQFRLCLLDIPSVRRKGGRESPEEKRKSRIEFLYGSAFSEVVKGFKGGVGVNIPFKPKYITLAPQELEYYQEAQTRALDLINELQRKKRRLKIREQLSFGNWHCKLKPGWGFAARLTKFTRLARHRILCGGAVIARKSATPSESCFVTLTLPGNTPEAMSALARWSSYVCNRLFQYVRRAEKKSGIRFDWFYSWELQHRNALHMHLCLHSASKSESLRVGKILENAWFTILKDVSVKSGVCLFSRSNSRECVLPEYWQSKVEPVEKSVACYVSKYISKDSSNNHSGRKFGMFCPPRWWGMSRALLKDIKEQSSTLVLDSLTEYEAEYLYQSLKDFFLSYNPVRHLFRDFEIGNESCFVGVGVSDDFYLDESSFNLVNELFPRAFSSLFLGQSCATLEGHGNWFEYFAPLLSFSPFLCYSNQNT